MNPTIKANPAVAKIISQVTSISEAHFYKVFKPLSIALLIVLDWIVETVDGMHTLLKTIEKR